ncbi:MAG TPA: hypothetical protein PK006_12360 [Saprospiraceae bacterium]|nr:hypothetical protein [Saprospiraceae bacterium]
MKKYSLFSNFKSLWILILLFASLFYASMSNAQTGNTGTTNYDYEVVEKCVDSAGVKVGFYEVYIHRAGFAPSLYNRYRANGSIMTTIPSGSVTLGSCPANITVAIDTTSEFEMLVMCDRNTLNTLSTPFLRTVHRIYNSKTGVIYSTTINNIDITSGATYTPAGNVYDGPCHGTTTTMTQLETSASGTISLGTGMGSWEVCNVGIATGTLTVSGVTINLYPGECRSCADWTSDFNHREVNCPSFTYDATGTQFHIVYQGR